MKKSNNSFFRLLCAGIAFAVGQSVFGMQVDSTRGPGKLSGLNLLAEVALSSPSGSEATSSTSQCERTEVEGGEFTVVAHKPTGGNSQYKILFYAPESQGPGDPYAVVEYNAKTKAGIFCAYLNEVSWKASSLPGWDDLTNKECWQFKRNLPKAQEVRSSIRLMLGVLKHENTWSDSRLAESSEVVQALQKIFPTHKEQGLPSRWLRPGILRSRPKTGSRRKKEKQKGLGNGRLKKI